MDVGLLSEVPLWCEEPHTYLVYRKGDNIALAACVGDGQNIKKTPIELLSSVSLYAPQSRMPEVTV